MLLMIFVWERKEDESGLFWQPDSQLLCTQRNVREYILASLAILLVHQYGKFEISLAIPK